MNQIVELQDSTIKQILSAISNFSSLFLSLRVRSSYVNKVQKVELQNVEYRSIELNRRIRYSLVSIRGKR